MFLIFLLFLTSIFADQLSYTVQPGDTLYGIARIHNIDHNVLARFNDIKSPYLLKLGDELKIPSTYTVQPGDTLYSLSKRFSVSVDSILAWNQLKNTTIQKNQKLYILGAESPFQHQPDTQPIPVLTKTQEIKQRRGKEYYSANGAVTAKSDGRVVWVGFYRGYEKICILEGTSGILFAYGGLNSIAVSVGDLVNRSDKIGSINPNKNKFIIIAVKDGISLDPDLLL